MRSDAVSGMLLVALGGYASYKALGFGLGVLSEPGAGFFPFIGGMLILVCGAVIGVRSFVRPVAAGARSGPPPGGWKLWACVAALFGYAIALPLVGFAFSTFLMLGALTRLDARTTWAGTLASAVLGAAGFWLIFARGLGVAFPQPLVGF